MSRADELAVELNRISDKFDLADYASWSAEACAELRRLSAVNAELLGALKRLHAAYSVSHSAADRQSCWEQARTAIQKAEEA